LDGRQFEQRKQRFMKFDYFRSTRFLSLSLILFLAGPVSASEVINWRSYEEGMAVSKIEQKKLYLHFYADWCGFCRKMAQDTFQDSAVVAYLNKNFIPVRVNTDKEQQKAADYGVAGLPFNLFLTDRGEPIISVPGYIPADTMLLLLKEINGIQEGG
jgi:thioredoxin-related protein